jgi:hypothetical protein
VHSIPLEKLNSKESVTVGRTVSIKKNFGFEKFSFFPFKPDSAEILAIYL